MRSIFLLLFALFASSANAQQVRTSRGDLLKQRQYATSTTGTTTVYVDATGNDANACTGTGTDACLTINGALAKLPKLIRNPTTVQVGAGNFGAFALSGFTLAQPGATLEVKGTLTTTTATTGSASGTATGGTAGSATAPTFGTLVQTGAGWTVNDFAGKLVEITGGTGAGQYRIITSNTVDTLTITGTWTAPTATSTFVIHDWGTVINTGATLAGLTLTTTYAVYIANNPADAVDFVGNIGLRWLKVAPPSGTNGVQVGSGGKVLIRESNMTVAGASQYSAIANVNAYARIVDSYMQTAFAGIGVTGIGYFQTLRCWIKGGQVSAWDSGQISTFDMRLGYMSGFTTSAYYGSAAGNSSVVLLSNIIDGAGSGSTICIQAISTTAPSPGYLRYAVQGGGYGNSISNCATAVKLDGPSFFDFGGVLTGSTNTTAISLANGARLKTSSLATITGTTEISVDGAAYTFVTLRALSPKRITDLNTLTTIWEQ